MKFPISTERSGKVAVMCSSPPIAASAESGPRTPIAHCCVLHALTKAARSGRDIIGAVTAVAPLDVIEADAALIRRITRPVRPDALGELGPEYKVFK